MKRASGGSRLPGLPRSESELELETEAKADGPEISWKEPAAPQTLRGAPDTVKMGPRAWSSPVDDVDDDDDDVTDVDTRRRLGDALVSEEAPSVAGVIGTESGPAEIVDRPPSGAVADSVRLSPSVAVEIEQATTTPMPPARRPSRPQEAATNKIARQATPIPPPEPGDSTVLVHAAPESSPAVATVLIALLAAGAGLGGGYALWGIGPDGAPAGTASVADATPAPAEPAKAAAPEPPPCTLAVRSEPAGARVRVDGEVVGATPVDLERPCGDVRVAIDRKRYRTLRRTVTLEPDSIGVVAVTLERPTFKVAIRSRPRGARVAVNGRDVGKTPVTVELPGFEAAELELSRRGFRPYKKTITPKRKRTRLRPRLRRR